MEALGEFSQNDGRKGDGLDDDDVRVGDDDDDVGRWVDVGSVKVVELKASTALSSSSSSSPTANSHLDHHHTHHHSSHIEDSIFFLKDKSVIK